jgi:Mg2+-importing ATPase
MQKQLNTPSKLAALNIDDVYKSLASSENGLDAQETERRLKTYGLNTFKKHRAGWLKIFWRQISGNPLSLILAAAALVAFATGDKNTGLYVLVMILVAIVLGFWNEFSAERTINILLKKITLQTVVLRNGQKTEVEVSHIVPGDIVLLAPGNIIPADLRLIQCDNLEINESALTGESKTVHKTPEKLEAVKTDSLSNLDNIGFMGTTVTDGWGTGIVIATGNSAEFGKIAEIAAFDRPRTQFQKGLAGFGGMIVKVILAMTVLIFAGNLLLGHGPLNSVLFALAVAVGLTPELLPVVVTVGLAHGAGKLAKHHVISKQLVAIENLGNMDVLCSDKTGTLTEGVIKVTSYVDGDGKNRPELLQMSILCNSAVVHHKPIGNSIDMALWQHAIDEKIHVDSSYKKIYEEPFDYDHRFMYCVARHGENDILIAKGAPEVVLRACSGNHTEQENTFDKLSRDGYRVIAIASKKIDTKKDYDWKDADNLHFEGFITFMDVPKLSARAARDKLHKLNVHMKVITGDNPVVTQKVCQEVDMKIHRLVLGSEIEKLSDKELEQTVEEANVFARVTPEHKLRIIQALQRNGHTVGFMGDGVNDVPSLHNADVGISVNTAIDVAKEAAQVVLLRQGLDVIVGGITEGRRTFMNTIKYILMGTGSNFGEMASTAGASFLLPFLPMSPAQILVENGLYDTSQLPIASDNVDEENLIKPKHWDIKMIYKFMLIFGSLSAVWMIGTFLFLRFSLHANTALFQTVAFLASITTEMVVVMTVRTTRVPFWRSRPSKWLAIGCLSILALAIWLPYSPLAHSLNFTAPPLKALTFLAIILPVYAAAVEFTKAKFLKLNNL